MNPFASPAQRVGIFIDTQNIYHSAKNFYGKNVDFGKLVEILNQGRNLVRTIAYVIKSDLSPKEISFFEALIFKGIELRIKDIIYLPGGEKKADWDVGIAVDTIRLSKFLDVIILVSGDGDFAPLVEYLKNQGNIVEIAGFGRNTSVKLKELADFFYDLDELKDYILIKK
ncbi:MAG: NYN domain-containing protein [Minisyncoccia bacterium]|jgi:uncharacterized LabA/DUF88 family protein